MIKIVSAFKKVVTKFVDVVRTKIEAAMPKVGNPANDYKGLVSNIETWTVKEDLVGHQHRMWATVRNGLAEVWVASTPTEIRKLISEWKADAKELGDPAYIKLVKDAEEILTSKPLPVRKPCHSEISLIWR